MTVTATFYDVGPGTDRDRPGLSHLLNAARASRFDRLLVNQLDRLTRTPNVIAGILHDLLHAGITLHCAAEPSGIITISPDAQAVIRLPNATTDDDTADHTARPRQATRQRHRR